MTVSRPGPASGQLFADHDRILGRGGEVRPLRIALADRAADGRMGVALDHGAEPVVEVVHPVAVDVPHDRTLAALEVDRPGIAQLVRGRDAAAEHLVGAVVHGLGPAGALVEAALLALGQLLDAAAVELGRGRSCHGSPGVRSG
jgi:hypothetical protein